MPKIKVFYTASYSGKEKYQKYYDLVLKSLLKEDIELIATELGNYKQILTKSDLKKVASSEEEHYLAIKKGIKWADLIVLELSHESFQVGHEATIAMLDKKRVLGLSIYRDWSKNIINDYFHGAKYNEYNIRSVINDFLNKYSDPKMSERLNLFLTPYQLAKLEKISKEKGVNMSEMVRNLIDKY